MAVRPREEGERQRGVNSGESRREPIVMTRGRGRRKGWLGGIPRDFLAIRLACLPFLVISGSEIARGSDAMCMHTHARHVRSYTLLSVCYILRLCAGEVLSLYLRVHARCWCTCGRFSALAVIQTYLQFREFAQYYSVLAMISDRSLNHNWRLRREKCSSTRMR